MHSTESITGTTYGDSTHFSGGGWKLSPQSFSSTYAEDSAPWKLTKTSSRLPTVNEEGVASPTVGSSVGRPHPSSLGLQQSSSHSRCDNSIFGGLWEEGQIPTTSMVEEDRIRVEKLLDIFRGMAAVLYFVCT